MEFRSAVDKVTSTTSLSVLPAVLVVRVTDLVDGAASCRVNPDTDNVEALMVSLKESCTVPAFMLRTNDWSEGGVVSGVYDAALRAFDALIGVIGFAAMSWAVVNGKEMKVVALEIARSLRSLI